MSRKDEILHVVDTLVRVHDEWETDPTAPDVPTDKFEFAIEDAISVCENGDTPEACRELVVSMARLGLEWESYRNGLMTPDNCPVDRFWGAFRAVLRSREGAVPFVPKRPEPVSVLLEQKVSHRQIAMNIYGDGKTGPFVGPDGQPDIRKIKQEAAQPGSVIPEGWVHPQQIELLRKFNEESADRLRRIEMRENSGHVIDKASIEELLREGQYPAAVARAKNVSLNEVMDVVHRLAAEGVEVNAVMPNLAAMRAPQEPQLTREQDAALQPRKGPDVEFAEEDGDDVTPPSPASTNDPAAIEQLIIELHQQHPDMGAGELATAIKDELGETVSAKKVAGILKRSKAEATEAETVGS